VLVRTRGWGGGGGRRAGASEGKTSWLLIKHRDDWSGPVDIAEFAPLSVKGRGDFADILSQGSPEIWHSHRPASGGEAGAMFRRIIERALAIRQAREGKAAAPAAPAKKVGIRTTTPARKPAAGAKKRAATKRKAVARKRSG
jgi:hypothetical protein